MLLQELFQDPDLIRTLCTVFSFITLTICPAPMTPSFFTSAAAPTEGVLLNTRHCCLAAVRIACLDAAENIVYNVQSS